MRSIQWSLVTAILLAHGLPAIGMEPQIQDAFARMGGNADRAAARSALVELRQVLSQGSAEVVSAVQAALCQTLKTAEDPLIVRRVTSLLAAAPSDQAIVTLLDRLDSAPSLPIRLALCEGLAHILEGSPIMQPGTQARLVSRLTATGPLIGHRTTTRPSGPLRHPATLTKTGTWMTWIWAT